MIGDAALRALRDAAGEAAVLEHDPLSLDGVKIGVTLAPESERALADTLARCREHDVAVVVRGGGCRIGVGNRPDASVRAWLSTAALAGACRAEADEGVVFASAATAVGQLDEIAREAGWLSPLEAAGPTSTVGGALASAIPGPRALGLGRARDVVLGLGVALPSGELTRCGARVVKNVSGYDLVKLQLGAFGTLGVLTGAWLRLRPQPETVRTLWVRGAAEPDALGLCAARRVSARAVALLDPVLAEALLVDGPPSGTGTPHLVVELAGDGGAVDEDERWLRARADVDEAPDGAIDGLRGLESSPALGALVFRLAASPSRLAAVRAGLHEAGARTIVQPGLGQVVAGIPLQREDEAAAEAACRAVHATLAGGSGHGVLERAPAWAKEGRDVFGARGDTLPLQRALKREFDPTRILNPGRFVGGL